MLRIRIAFCASLLLAGAAHASIDNAGTTAGNFLAVGTGAGILSMGGATLGFGQDLNAAAWNPAALGRLTSSQFSISHASLAAQSTQEWLAAGGRVGRASTRWSTTALYQGDGSFDGRDALGASTGSFSVSSMALGLQVAQPIGQALVAGVGAHWLADKLGDASGHGLGFDAGVQGSVGEFGLGAAVRNVGGSMQYDAGRFDLPAVYGVGASWSHAASGLRMAIDANFPRAYYNDVRLGGEWRWQERVALRAGYRMELGAAAGEPLGGPTFGFGAGANGMWMDYAFLASGAAAQGQHRLGLTFRPGFLNQAMHPASRADATSSAPNTTVAAAPPARAAAPAPVASAAPARSAPQAPAPAPVVRPAPTPAPVAAPAPVADAQTELPPANALQSEVAPRPLASAKPATVKPSRPVRVNPLVMPSRAELAQVAATLAPPKPAPAIVVPRVAVTPAPKPAAPAVAAPLAAAQPVAAPPAPVVAAPVPEEQAPTPAPAPAPIAQVASSAPRVIVVTRPAEPGAPAQHAPVSRPASVTVRKGETLADIARRWQTSPAAIMMQNNLVRETVSPGQKLKLPQ